MFNPHTKFEVLLSTITCNGEMKGNAKYVFYGFEPLSGDLRVTHRVHLWIDGKRIVDLLLVLSELFPLALTAVALLSKICRNRHFLKGGSL